MVTKVYPPIASLEIQNDLVDSQEDLIAVNEDTGIPNGFVDRTESTIAFNAGTREFSVTKTGVDYSYYIKFAKHTLTTVETVTIPDTEGLHYIYFSGGTGTLTSTITFSSVLFFDFAWVSTLYWDQANQEIVTFGDERHGIVMDPNTHSYLHFVDGMRFGQGIALGDITADGNGSLDSHATLSVAAGIVYDEDLRHSIATLSSPANIAMYYRLGAAGNWRLIAANNAPVARTLGGNAEWNEFTGGAWQLTAAGNNDFILVHLYATNNVTNQIIAIVGQDTYGTLNQARTGAEVELLSLALGGLPVVEFKSIATIIYKTNSAYANTFKSAIQTTSDGDDYIDWRSTSVAPGTAASDHNSLGGLQGGAAGEFYHQTSDEQTKTVFSGNDDTVDRINLKDYGEITQAKGNLGATPAFDLEDGNSITGTVDQNITSSTMINPTASDENSGFTLLLTNGGAFTIVWPPSFKWAGGIAPTLTTSGNDTIVGYTVDGGTTYKTGLALADSK